MNNVKIIFFGTSEFAVPALEALVKNGWPIVCVVTQPDKLANRGLKMESSPVKIKALELGMKVFQPETLKSAEIVEELKSFGAEVAVLASYGKIISKSVIDIFPKGILNIHPSLLPKYRGSSPIQAAILNGDKETGVTIMLLDEEMDHGPIVASSKFKVQSSKFWYVELEKELAGAGAELLIETLPDWLADKIKPREQNHTEATYTKLLAKDDGRIDWRKPAEEIERMVRAYDPWPGTWTDWQGKRLKILQVEILGQEVQFGDAIVGQVFSISHLCHSPDSHRGNPGDYSMILDPRAFASPKWLRPRRRVKPEDDKKKEYQQGNLVVKCGRGFLIMKNLQLEGKVAVSGEEFLRGHKKIIDSILGT